MGALRENFVLAYSVDGTINYILHQVRYYRPNSKEANAKATYLAGQKPNTERTDLNLRPTLVTFLDTLYRKYGPPSEKSPEMFHTYSWFLDDGFHNMNPSKVWAGCKQAPLDGASSDGIAGHGTLLNTPYSAAANYGAGIWVRADTEMVDNQEIVTGYTIKIYDQTSAYKDMMARKASIPVPVPDNAHRPRL